MFGVTPAATHPYPGYGPPPASGRTSGHAIASLVFGLIGGVPFSVAFGLVGLHRTRPGGEQGRGLAIAGLTLSGLWIVGMAVVVGIVIGEGADRDSTGIVTGAGTVAVTDLAVGDCLGDLTDEDEVTEVSAVPCSQAHVAEVFALVTLPDGKWPGLTAIDRTAGSRCEDDFAAYSPSHARDDSIVVSYFYPSEESWNLDDDRTVACFAELEDPSTGSLRG